MKDTIDEKNYLEMNNAFILCEYHRELELIKRLIYVTEAGIEKQIIEDTWSFEGVCYSFAKTSIFFYICVLCDIMILNKIVIIFTRGKRKWRTLRKG